MKIFFFIYLISLSNQIKEKDANEDGVVKNLLGYLDPNDKEINIESIKNFNARNRKNFKIECIQKKTRSYVRGLLKKFDTGFRTCGWEISKIKYNCKNNYLFDLFFDLRNKNYYKEKNETNLIRKNLKYEELTIQNDDFIKMVNILYKRENYKKYITGLEILLNSKKILKIKCGDFNKKETFYLTEKERINGFRLDYNKKYISKIEFYYHRIIGYGIYKKLDYYKSLKSNLTVRNNNITSFIKKGPFGYKRGKVFEDFNKYSDWRLDFIYIESGNYINSIQFGFENRFFDRKIFSPIHGNRKRNKKKMKIVKIPKGSFINGVFLFFDRRYVLRGIQFSLNNGMKTKIFGKSRVFGYKFRMKKIWFTNMEVLIGCFGTTLKGIITSIGLLLIKDRGDNMSIFK